MGGLGALAGKKGKKAYWAAMAAQGAHNDALAAIRNLQPRMETDINKIRRIGQQTQDMVYQIESLVQQSGSEQAFGMIQSTQTAAFDVQAIVDEAESEYQSFEDEFNAARAKGGNYATGLAPKAESAAGKLKTLASRVGRASSMISSSFARIQAQAKKAAGMAAGQAAASAAQQRLQDLQLQRQAEMEDRRYQDQIRREEQQRQREDEARQREREYEMQARQEEQAREQEERQREEDERARRDAADQARIDAELRREEMAIQAEQRRFAMEQERILREEERELRKEEREAELQRLVMMQELASKGVPIDLGPAGGAAMGPQVPGFGPPGYPGMMPGMMMPGQPRPGMMPGYPGAPGMLPGYPGAPGMMVPGVMPGMMPGMPGPPPGYPGMPGQAMPGQAMPGQPVPYAAQPPRPAYQQGGAIPPFQQAAPGVPSQAPPSGMAWAAFDPASELFGMGALRPSSNPTLRGAQIDDSYILRGQGGGPYQIVFSRDGTLVNFQGKTSFSLAEMMAGPITDAQAKGAVVYVPPTESPTQRNARIRREREDVEANRDAVLNQEIARGIFSTTGEIARAVGAGYVAREQRKAAKYGGPQYGGGQYGGGGYQPPLDYQQGGQRRGGSPLLLIGALGIGAAMLALATSGGKKKKKQAEE
jgi:hypothetical protein